MRDQKGWASNIEYHINELEKAGFSLAVIAGALAMGTGYAYIIIEAVPGLAGWIMGPLAAIGMELGGIRAFITAIRKRGMWWWLAVAYVITHILTLVLVKLFNLNGFPVVMGSLIVVASLVYIGKGEDEALAEQKAAAEKKEQKEAQEAEKAENKAYDQIEIDKAKALADLEIDDMRIRMKAQRSADKKAAQPKTSAPLRQHSVSTPSKNGTDSAGQPARLTFNTLTPEIKQLILSTSYGEFKKRYGVSETSFYDWKRSLKESTNGVTK